MALDLPYYTAQSIHGFPRGTLVVRIDADNAEAMSAGYANAVSCVGGVTSRNNVYIEDKKMLDTEYADSLVDFPRFW